MSVFNRLSNIFESSDEIPFDDSSKIVLMSDCHRGDGSWADDFSKNQNLYVAALTHYYREKFTYIELGDGDELWENSKISNIIHIHKDVFWLLTKFYEKGRLHMVFGNHDIVKENTSYIEENLHYFFYEREQKYYPLFPNVKIHEGLVLKHSITGDRIFLVHGHQADFLNSTLWRLSRFLVKHLWRRLEIFGVNDPTSAAKNYKIKWKVEKKLRDWVIRNKQMLIAGHTHKPVFPEVADPPYFNDGSCVHPRGIIAIEITEGYILLVKWQVKTKLDGTLYVGREMIAGPRMLEDIFIFKNDK
ncbi:MAG: serine/threonine protein phosphatase [Firmicutes bacterium HGW-Firmicutes-1]|jgi:predicted phosphodiesterase|nr:MAG: serine/threonine protein phosphatase [Firmicutes bacterium HGW-Firmicutes-1]